MKALAFATAFFVGYYALCVYGFARGGGIAQLRRLKGRTVLIAVGMLALMVLFVAFEVGRDQYIYYWDSRLYWGKSIDFAAMLSGGVSEAARQLAASIANDGYNLLLPAIIALPLKVFGFEYSHYVVVIATFFLAPAFFALATLITKFTKTHLPLSVDGVFLLTLGLVLCFPLNYRALLLGYIDGASLLAFVVLLMLACNYDFDRRRGKGDLAIALLVVFVVLARRYNSFFVVGYAALMIAIAVIAIGRARAADRRARTLSALAHYAFMLAVVAAIMLIGFGSMVHNILVQDYAVAFDAYDSTYLEKVKAIVHYFGWFDLAVVVAGGVISCVRRENRTIFFLLLGDVLFILWLFFRVQMVDNHHLYVILSQMEWLVALGFLSIVECCLQRWRRLIVVGAAALYLCNMAYVFIPAMRTDVVNESHLFSTNYDPRVRDDIPVIGEIVDYLNELYDVEGLTSYIAASGIVFNHDVVRASRMPYEADAVRGQLTTGDVDARDGFPTDFFKADIVVTTDPIETHLKAGSQEIVRFLAAEVMDPASPIGRHFELLKTFEVDDGIQVRVYRKTSPFTEADIEYLRRYFDGLYPDQPELFNDRIDAAQKELAGSG